jgi:DNA-binding protein HU-beta
VNKSELIEAVATRTGASAAEARRNVEAVIDAIVEGVAAGERVSVTGFGTFDSATRQARTARNPRTGAVVDVPAAVVPRFRTGTAFKARVATSNGVIAASGTTTKPRAAKAAAAVAEAPGKADKKNAKATKAKPANATKAAKNSKNAKDAAKKGKKAKKK